MNIFYLVIFFILGSCMGSFYTVVGLRLPKKESFITTRSHCDACGHTLALIDMVPIFSYLFLGKKCRYCKKKIEGLSTYMELFTGVLFALSYFRFGISYEFFTAIGIVSMLSILSVSDITYYVIPDEILIFFTGYFLIIGALSDGVMMALMHLLSGMILFGFMYLIMLFGNIVFKKETLGGGDIKLMFVVGLILHPFLGLFVIFLASFLALPISLFILWKKKQHLVPFGPFLLTGFLFVYMTGIKMKMVVDFIRSF